MMRDRGDASTVPSDRGGAQWWWLGAWRIYGGLSNVNFLASPANSGELFLINGTNISTDVDVAAYDHTVMALLNAFVRHVVDVSPPMRMFAMGQVVGLDPTIPNIWSIAQCYLRGWPMV
jgi:hypothetical protein